MAGFFSLAHGANDVANSVGPFGAVLAAWDGPLEKKSETPVWVFAVAGVMIAVGLATYGVHVMQTIGNKITEINPPKAFCVNFSATLVVLLATRMGMPISTTHASVGAVVGVGLAEGVTNVNWKVMLKVLTSWVLTLPIVGITTAWIFAIMHPMVVDVPLSASSLLSSLLLFVLTACARREFVLLSHVEGPLPVGGELQRSLGVEWGIF